MTAPSDRTHLGGTSSAGAALDLYTIPEAAAVLRVPEGWLRKKVTARLVPHTRLGKHVRFTAEHLRRIVEDGEPQPSAAPTRRTPSLSARVRRRPLGLEALSATGRTVR